MKLDIVTPERRLKSLSSSDVSLPCEVSSVVIPGREGQFEVLRGHEPFVTLLGTGALTFETGGRKVSLMVSGGFCEVDRDQVSIMCESAAMGEEIDRGQQESAHTRFQQELAALGVVSADDPESLRLRAEIERAATKLTLTK